MNKRRTVERHFGKTWVCLCTRYGEAHVKAEIHTFEPPRKNPENNPRREKPFVYTGIGGFTYRKDFDFDVAASAAISVALNRAGYYTLEY